MSVPRACSGASASARRADIALRYGAATRERKREPVSIAALRIAELRRLFTARYGRLLPDDDAGRDDAFIMASHLAKRPEAERRIPAWLSLWAPWLTAEEVADLTTGTISKLLRWRADKLAWRLRLTEDERRRLRITTIGAIDLTKAQRLARRRLHKRLCKEARRRHEGAKSRTEYEANSINRTKPWLALGMSRRSWYRAGKPTP
jgi:hypothetical protein